MVRYRIYTLNDIRYIDAIGKYVYVSVHFRGTSVNIQPQGGFLLGIGGVLTYKNSELGKTLKEAASLEDLVLETDAPYLPPTPYRGKRNESAYMIEVAYKLVDLFQVPLEEIARITTLNAEELFQLNRF